MKTDQPVFPYYNVIMSARYTPKEIHPSIFEAVLSVTGAYTNGTLTDPKAVKAATYHSSVWFAEYWKGIFVLGLGFLGSIAATAFAAQLHLGKGVTVLVFMAFIALSLFAGMKAYEKNKKLLTWEELEALRPALDLTEHQSLYVECLQYVEESKVLDENQKRSWRTVLYNALDQAIVLTKLSDEMQHSSGSKNQSENLTEISRIESQMERTSDPIAKDAYGESLRLAKDRLSKWDSIAVQAERTEAHLELTKQTFLKTRDTLKGMSLQNQQAVQIDLEPLRANLSRVESEAHEIQRAIEELRQI